MDLLHHQTKWEEVLEEAEDKSQGSRPWREEVESDKYNVRYNPTFII